MPLNLLETSQRQQKKTASSSDYIAKDTTVKKVEAGYTEEDFWLVFNELTKDLAFGTIEMTVIAGAIDTIKVNRNFKITEVVDENGRKVVQLR